MHVRIGLPARGHCYHCLGFFEQSLVGASNLGMTIPKHREDGHLSSRNLGFHKAVNNEKDKIMFFGGKINL